MKTIELTPAGSQTYRRNWVNGILDWQFLQQIDIRQNIYRVLMLIGLTLSQNAFAAMPSPVTEYRACWGVCGGWSVDLNAVGAEAVALRNAQCGGCIAAGDICTFTVVALPYAMGNCARSGNGVTVANIFQRQSCPVNFTLDSSTTSCVEQGYTITLTGDSTTEPSTNISFTATVKNKSDNQPPTSPVTVKVSLKVDATSGGHDHGNSTRPRGGLNNVACTSDDTCIEGTTDGNGVMSFSFNPTDASGTHTIMATCDKCGNSDSKSVDVKVAGLEPIPDSQFYQLYERAGNTYKAVGETDKHHSNHFLTPAASEVLWRIAVSYQFEPQFKLPNSATGALVPPALLHVNDASLIWGGKFDINGGWKGDHKEHMRGTVVDVRANNVTGAIPSTNFDDFKKLARYYGVDPHFESPSIDRQHFHLRLFDRKE